MGVLKVTLLLFFLVTAVSAETVPSSFQSRLVDRQIQVERDGVTLVFDFSTSPAQVILSSKKSAPTVIYSGPITRLQIDSAQVIFGAGDTTYTALFDRPQHLTLQEVVFIHGPKGSAPSVTLSRFNLGEPLPISRAEDYPTENMALDASPRCPIFFGDIR